MDLTKRTLAPITNAAWEEIESGIRDALRTHLTARKVVDVGEPGGWSRTCVGLGRLEVPKGQGDDGVQYGIHRVQPLVETRVQFSLNVWELDNAERGAADVDVDAAEEAARKIAEFEDHAIFNGFPKGDIPGIANASPYDPIALGGEASELLDSVAKGLLTLRDAGVEGPYAFVTGAEAFRRLMSCSTGYPLKKHLERMFDGKVVYSPVVDGAFLISMRGGDLELVLGQDLTVGYETHDAREVRLFLAESFTFRILEPKVVVAYTV